MQILTKSVLRLLRRMRENIWLSALIISLLTTGFSLVVINHVALATLAENHLADVRMAMLTRPRPQSTNIAIVLIDDDTLAGYPYRSPLDRSLIAGLLDELENRGVAAIGIDVYFDRPTEPHKDRQLAARLQRLAMPVVVSRVSASTGFSAKQVAYSNEFLGNLRTGLSLIYRDPVDHTVRGSLLKRVQGRTIHLGFAAAMADALGVELPPEERILIDYRPGPDLDTPAFPIFRAHELRRLPASELRGRIVLIGSDLGDSGRLRTPLSVLAQQFSRDLPGVVIEAHILSQLLEGRSVKRWSAQQSGVLALMMAIAGCLVSLMRIRLVFKLFLALVLLPLAWIAAFSVYIYQHSLVPLVAPTFAFIVALLISAFWQWRNELAKRESVHDAFGHYLAPAVVERILREPEELELGGEVREITFLFTDLEGFTHLTESTPPQQMVRLVNRYLDEACDIVSDHDGTLDKIVGDALHVMFNAPLLQPDHARRAVECALALDHWAREFRERVRAEGVELGVTRIGVNTGRCIVGNFGGKRRFDYTAHGDAINTAARLESVNQRLGTTVCVSEASASQCDGIVFRPVATLVLRGKTAGVKAYLPVVEAEVDAELIASYAQAYAALEADLPEAGDWIAALELRYPDDPLIKLHARRIEAGERGTTMVIRKK